MPLATSDDMRTLALARGEDARLLLDGGRFAAAYYLSGYAVECALKAILTRNLGAYLLPDPPTLKSYFTHDLAKLADYAEVARELATDADRGPSWTTVRSWSEESRYRLASEIEATEMVEAVLDPTNGVLPWLVLRW